MKKFHDIMYDVGGSSVSDLGSLPHHSILYQKLNFQIFL